MFYTDRYLYYQHSYKLIINKQVYTIKYHEPNVDFHQKTVMWRFKSWFPD